MSGGYRGGGGAYRGGSTPIEAACMPVAIVAPSVEHVALLAHAGRGTAGMSQWNGRRRTRSRTKLVPRPTFRVWRPGAGARGISTNSFAAGAGANSFLTQHSGGMGDESHHEFQSETQT